jgi:hypothetical protein
VRVALGLLWLLDAALQAQPAKFAAGYPLGTLAQSVMGDPGWANRSIFAAIHLFVAHWATWNLAAVAVQAAIALALITDRLVRPAVLASIAWALVVWWLGEGFGLLPSGFAIMAAGAPGAVLLYPLLGLLAWPHPDGSPEVSERAWRSCWLVLWVGTAVLQIPFVHGPGVVLSANLEELRSSVGVLAAADTGFAGLAAHHAAAISVAMGLAQAAIGVGAAFDRPRIRWWLGSAVALSLFYWVVFQQLGGLPSFSATDPNLGPLVVLLALAAWPRAAATDSAEPRTGRPRSVGAVAADQRASATTTASSPAA